MRFKVTGVKRPVHSLGGNEEYIGKYFTVENGKLMRPFGRGECGYYHTLEEQINFMKKYYEVEEEIEMTKILVGVNDSYQIGDYEIRWKYGEDYLKEDEYSRILICDGNDSHYMKIHSLSDINKANNLLQYLNISAEIMEEEKVEITTTDGQTITISKEKAEELGFNIKRD